MKPRPRTASFYSLNAGGATGKRQSLGKMNGLQYSKVQGILMECWGVAVDMRMRLRLPFGSKHAIWR